MPKRVKKGRKVGGFLPLLAGGLAIAKMLGAGKNLSRKTREKKKGGYIPRSQNPPRLQIDKGYLINQPYGAGKHRKRKQGKGLLDMLHFLV